MENLNMKKRCENFTKFCPKPSWISFTKLPSKLMNLACTFYTENINISTFCFFIVHNLNSNHIPRLKLIGNMCTVQHRWRKEETAIEQKHKLWLLLCIIVTVKHECIVAIFRRKYHHICKYILIFFSFLKSSSPVTAYLCKYIVGQRILLILRAREFF